MCGIVGYTGTDGAAAILVNGLSKLEYRGYDSAGVALERPDGSGLEVVRRVGKVAMLRQALVAAGEVDEAGAAVPGCATCGIGHTRWATHGRPTEENAHPHTSCDGRIAIVHNGIIENFAELREELVARGHVFKSETDTEVLAHLLEEAYYGRGGKPGSHDLVSALRQACEYLVGAYGVAAVCEDEPGVIAVARKDSPIVIGCCEQGSYVASDAIAIMDATRDVVVLEDGVFARLTPQGATFTNAAGEAVEPPVTHIDWSADAAEKGGYPDFMLKEIYEQPRVVRDTLAGRLAGGALAIDELGLTLEELNLIDRVYVIACGTSYHAGLVAKNLIEGWARIPCEVEAASEFRYRNPIITTSTLVVAVSQSGETADTLAALREAKRQGCRTLSIVNVVGSSIANESDDVIYTWAGPEIAVATTKAYSTQLTVIYLIAVYIAEKLQTADPSLLQDIIEELQRIPQKLQLVLDKEDTVQYLASKHYNSKDVFFLGRNLDYAVGLEGSLKLKEISYIHSEAYAAGEIKHGTISLIEEGSLVVALVTQENLSEKMMSNIKEVKARGAVVLALAMESNREVEREADYVLRIPDTNPFLTPSLAVVPLQLFGYYVASMKGCDIDKPRNLAKSVTVE